MPRAGLSRAAVVELATQLVDELPGGPEALTLAAVAQRAGVATPSLYKHIGSLDALRAEVALVGAIDIRDRLRAATVGVAGVDALRALAEALRSYAREHPGLYLALQRAAGPQDPELVRVGGEVVDVIAAVLRGFGLPPERAVDAVRTTRAALHGFVLLENGGGFGLPDDVDRSFAALVDVLATGITALREE
ncbi:TetR/AcrR family transcriptional regulator [Schumannella sp. 10F1B-5-1]|uniref:TetR/AcrR family transcriptional regulator n=1 Tax=Schumannella sp. 10F1B-5-1 TaxID=2590780 RepID=UPI00113103BE|nr:TetR/AcrR family transcriptional regulator [Schumannella sp. 10F1B-5-1]TPW70094.1 TetR/AcrR family transcriptional regulator [Schumannella sp. 10F1B-5-1]